ncbi:membrane protein insertase YidC [Marinomonas posidonica]|uniref:Membrane protein insertase YidC n=1 Tax=Marinomonas posidonica (strain CECT 7376 / NCIMB 14433 / IVIA-Po-181) TaxID=491952 RepID=F6CVT4_MARPP|nr:membrane protein insertase YidC [Marinomonas posidonica]AEF56558.1 Membrane protein oxaA [Marinomonas posidonica IVIA-Po-181]
MDFRRYFLWGALFISGYLLFLQWNQDYGQQSTQSVAQSTQSQNETNSQLNDDLPLATQNNAEASSEIPQSISTIAPGKLIEVTTDTLRVAINPVGGDLVEAALLEYKKELGQPDPFVILEDGPERTYVTQTGLIGRNGPDASTEGRPVYQSEQTSYQLADGKDSLDVNLYYTDKNGVKYTKTFRFMKGTYRIRQLITVDNTSANTWRGNLFAQIKRDNSPDPSKATSMGLQPYLGGAISDEETKYSKVSFSDMEEEPVKVTTTQGWVALLQHYFVSAWIPEQGQKVTLQARTNNGYNIIGFTGSAVEIPAGKQGTMSSTFYVGPKLQGQLEATAENLDLTVDYGWLWWLAKPLFWLLTLIQSFVINWGVAIILVVVCVKAIFFKLSATSYRSMAKMRKFGPEIAKLKDKHGDDRQKMSQAMMELYKKEKINPLGGCLPILVQMPVFLALYWVLMESVELRQAPFILWIDDLSVMDPFFILPILMGISMFVQQALNPTPPDPMQARIMKIMPVAFSIFFLWFPAGLVLYWVTNNTLSILQQYVITKRIERED